MSPREHAPVLDVELPSSLEEEEEDDHEQQEEEDISEEEEVPTPTLLQIADLTGHEVEPWCVRGLVVTKSTVLRTYSNGCVLFTFTLRDHSAVDIECTVFQDHGALEHFDEIIVGRCYSFSNCTTKLASKQYSLTTHNLELKFGRDTEFEPIPEGLPGIAPLQVNTVPISEVANASRYYNNSLRQSAITVMGVKVRDSGVETKLSNGREVFFRAIYLKDQSGGVVKVCLWDHEATEPDFTGTPVVLVYGARLKICNKWGAELKTIMNSMVLVNPDLPGVEELREWYATLPAEPVAWSNFGASTSGVTPRAYLNLAANATHEPDANRMLHDGDGEPEVKKVKIEPPGLMQQEMKVKTEPNFSQDVWAPPEILQSTLVVKQEPGVQAAGLLVADHLA